MHTATSRFAPISTPKSFPKIAAKSAKVRHQKAPKKPKSTRRSGPLDARVREKAEEMRDIGACWRCKKYKKSVSMRSVLALIPTNILLSVAGTLTCATLAGFLGFESGHLNWVVGEKDSSH